MNKKTILGIAVIALTVIVAFTACSGNGGGGKSLNSATELKEYLDKQPANSPDQPIKVAMKANDMMIKDIAEVIKNAGKYVRLDLSGSPLTEIPERAFENCKTLAGIIIPNGVTGIGSWAFSGTGLTSVTIPASVTFTGGAFYNCTNLTSITVESGNTNYASEGGILYNKAKTEIIQVPKGISGNVTIPNGVTSIGRREFEDCDSITSITIPSSVTSIDRWVIPGCTSLTSVTFQGTIAEDALGIRDGSYREYAFGSLDDKYLAEGPGTYTRSDNTWTKQ